MTDIVILGDSISAICAAHTIIDSDTKYNLHLVSEKAELGLSGEAPGILTSWPPCPSHWVSEMGSQKPNEESSAVRRSWLEKSLATQLSKRGCRIHLRTRAVSYKDNRVTIVGAGPLSSGNIHYDELLDLRDPDLGEIEWSGGVCLTEYAPEFGKQGNRSDGTTEVWWKNKENPTGFWIQQMNWVGDDPSTSLIDDVREGTKLADLTVDTIIQTNPSQ